MIAQFLHSASVFFGTETVPKWRNPLRVATWVLVWDSGCVRGDSQRAWRSRPGYGVPVGLGDGCELPAGGEPNPLKPLPAFWRAAAPAPLRIARPITD